MIANVSTLHLECRRLYLRPFGEEHIQPAYIGWLNDPATMRYSNQRFLQHTEDSCRNYLRSFTGTSNQFLAVEEKASGRMIGTVTIYRSLPHQTADIGLMIGDTSVWGQGFGLEAFSCVVDALLAGHEVRKVTAGTLAANLGMVKIMERSGLTWEATRRGQELFNGEPMDILYYARFHEV